MLYLLSKPFKYLFIFFIFLLSNRAHSQIIKYNIDSSGLTDAGLIFNKPKDFNFTPKEITYFHCLGQWHFTGGEINIKSLKDDLFIFIEINQSYNRNAIPPRAVDKIDHIKNSKISFKNQADTINYSYLRYSTNFLQKNYNADYYGGEYQRGCRKVDIYADDGNFNTSNKYIKKTFQNCRVVYFAKENYANVQVYYLYNDESKEYVESIIPKTYEIIRFKPDLN